MLIALFADIHANRQAFSACLKAAHVRGAEQFVLLGDYVGYGGDPEWAVDTVMDLAAKGATAVRGNHDTAVGNPRVSMNVEARVAIEWTRHELGLPARDFLARLPLAARDADRLYVHADASAPDKWIYVTDVMKASRCLAATHAHVTVCGHVHRPAIYSMSATARMTAFAPVADVPIPLLPGRRWLVVLGAVGQPRDGNPAACWALLDTARQSIVFCRTPYDVAGAAEAIRARGLPSFLAERLFKGI